MNDDLLLVSDIAVLLTRAGYPMTIRPIHGAIHSGALASAELPRRVRLADALAWAEHRATGVHGEVMSPALLGDQIIFFLRTNYPDDYLLLTQHMDNPELVVFREHIAEVVISYLIDQFVKPKNGATP